METSIRPSAITLIAKFIRILSHEGLIYVSEEQEILSNLRHLSKTGDLLPKIVPKLIDQRTAAEMLGLSYSNFRKLESSGYFDPYFKRKNVGTAVRFRNTDIVKFMMNDS